MSLAALEWVLVRRCCYHRKACKSGTRCDNWVMQFLPLPHCNEQRIMDPMLLSHRFCQLRYPRGQITTYQIHRYSRKGCPIGKVAMKYPDKETRGESHAACGTSPHTNITAISVRHAASTKTSVQAGTTAADLQCGNVYMDPSARSNTTKGPSAAWLLAAVVCQRQCCSDARTVYWLHVPG